MISKATKEPYLTEKASTCWIFLLIIYMWIICLNQEHTRTKPCQVLTTIISLLVLVYKFYQMELPAEVLKLHLRFGWIWIGVPHHIFIQFRHFLRPPTCNSLQSINQIKKLKTSPQKYEAKEIKLSYTTNTTTTQRNPEASMKLLSRIAPLHFLNFSLTLSWYYFSRRKKPNLLFSHKFFILFLLCMCTKTELAMLFL